jgi:hypothetical protein
MPAPHASTAIIDSSSDVCTTARARARALEQRELDAVRGEDAREHVADRDPGARRPHLLGAGEAHEAAHALRDLVEARAQAVRTVGAEPGDPAVDELRELLGELLRREPEALHHVGAVVLHEHVEVRQDAHEQLARLGAAQVERGDRLPRFDDRKK